MRKPVAKFSYLAESVDVLKKAAARAVSKLDRGEQLTDVELLGVVAIASPDLLTFETCVGDKVPPSQGGNPMLSLMDQGRAGSMESEYVKISTNTSVNAVLEGKSVVLRRG